MAKKKMSTVKGQPLVFNANGLADKPNDQVWLGEVLESGKLVACPSEIGMVVWARADRNLSVQMAALRDVVSPDSWVLGIAERTHCWSYWREEPKRDELEQLFQVFWPGPLFAVNVANAKQQKLYSGVFRRKLPLWCPYSGLCNIVIKACDFPVAAARFKLRDGLYPLNVRDIAQMHGQQLEVILEGRERAGHLEYSIIDVSGSMLRLVRRGAVLAEDLRKVWPRPIMLSGEAIDSVANSLTSGVRLIVVEGDPERVARRMRAFVDGLDEQENVHYFVHSACVLQALGDNAQIHRLCDDNDVSSITDAFAWQKLGVELWGRICRLEKEQGASVVLIEGVSRNEGTEEFMERLVRLAHQVVNLSPSE